MPFLFRGDSYKTLKIWDGVKMPGGGGGLSYAETPQKNGDVLVERTGEPLLEFFGDPGFFPGKRGLVIVCPGGAYKYLSFEREGRKAAEFLSKNCGTAAAVLKYRVPDNPEGALFDLQRAIRLARANAGKWNILPDKIAVMGFSAGANLCARASTRYGEKTYQPLDSADSLSARPDAAILVYPAYCDKTGNDLCWKGPAKKPGTPGFDAEYALADELKVDKNTPPAFIVQTQADKEYVNSSVAYYLALKKAGAPANLHLFDKGKHGFAFEPGNIPVKAWTGLLADWIKDWLSAPGGKNP